MRSRALRPAPALAWLLLGVAFAATAARAAPEQRAIDRVFAGWSGHDRPGCALAVEKAGRIRYARGYGMANLETGTANTPATIFDIGSVSKQFTAMAVLLLVLDGKLSLDDDVRRYLPELRDYGTRITVGHLLHHTSGLRNYTDLFDLAGVPEVDLSTARDALELIARQRGVNFQANEEFLYSDTNYFLAGEIVRRVSGQSLRDFAAARIFAPLGMTHTHFSDQPREVVAGRATGYEPGAHGYLNYLSNFEQVGDGSVLTTVLDLAKWERNFATPRVGGAAAIRLMTEPAILNDGTPTPYGMGLFIDRYRGLRWIHHDGEWVGYRAAISRWPSERLSVIVTCNVLGSLDPMALALEVGDLYLADRPRPPPPVPATARPASDAARYAGLYWSPQQGRVRRFTARGGALELGTGGVRLIAEGAGEYRTEGETKTRYRFGAVADGTGGSLEAHTFGTTTHYRRVTPQSAPAAELAAFTGRFASEDLPGEWHLVAEGGRLLRRQAFTHDLELTPLFADTFIGSLSEGDFIVHFERDAEQRVSALLVSSEMLRPLRLTKIPPPAAGDAR